MLPTRSLLLLVRGYPTITFCLWLLGKTSGCKTCGCQKTYPHLHFCFKVDSLSADQVLWQLPKVWVSSYLWVGKENPCLEPMLTLAQMNHCSFLCERDMSCNSSFSNNNAFRGLWPPLLQLKSWSLVIRQVIFGQCCHPAYNPATMVPLSVSCVAQIWLVRTDVSVFSQGSPSIFPPLLFLVFHDHLLCDSKPVCWQCPLGSSHSNEIPHLGAHTLYS